MKKSSLGLNFFAHKSRGACRTAPETEEHLVLKTMAVEAARTAGWTCSTEVRGSSPSGEAWTADVLAERGAHKIAVEIQWSGQTSQETCYRQERYRQSDVRCLWLARRPFFPISKEVPAVCVGGDNTAGFQARIPSHGRISPRDFHNPARWAQVVPMSAFLEAVFAGRFRYGVPVGASATVTVHSGVIDCWKLNCQAQTRIVTFIEVEFGPHQCRFTVTSLGAFPDLLSTVLSRILPSPGIGAIKRRYSQTVEESYMSNGCYKCDALIGQHFEHLAWCADERVLASFPITISERWRKAIEMDNEDGFGWGIYPVGQ